MVARDGDCGDGGGGGGDGGGGGSDDGNGDGRLGWAEYERTEYELGGGLPGLCDICGGQGTSFFQCQVQCTLWHSFAELTPLEMRKGG